MYVRLAADWADPSGAVHGAGEFVDVDIVTLAELEERGVVENAEEIDRPGWVGPGKTDDEIDWVGPGDESDSTDDDDAADGDQES
ncbi:MAG: hypothetical protein AUI14_02830 [Actinobacteria bacterium 13_2_20CM_2_71_6]|nr:MAG: hypothetical protein AUI14_02830 [Actinobacteria bacterium 13_2_20CM_2_71_6]